VRAKVGEIMPRRPKYKLFRTSKKSWAVGKKTKVGGFAQSGYYRVIDGVNLKQEATSKRTRFERMSSRIKNMFYGGAK